MKIAFYTFDDGSALLEGNKSFDIIILDIKMEEIDGIAVKDKLYSLGDDSKIIFLTGHSSYIKEAFGRNVYGFVDKMKILDMLKYMDIIINELKNTRLINLSGYLIDIWKIQYIKADRVYCNLYSNLGEVKVVRKTLKEIEDLLKNSDLFVRTHRSYIVNLRYVNELDTKHIILENTTSIPISSLYYDDVKQKIKKFR